jgi:D-glycero-D-manno-heptose 1,7-bisphosphate phosphatase
MERALFLDRDGVINHDHAYVHKIVDFQFVEGIFDLCHDALSADYRIVVVTNQAGIGRGLYTEAQFETLTSWMIGQFANRGIAITDVLYCPHHPEHGMGLYHRACDCRKPRPGMLLEAGRRHNLDLSASVLVGDKLSDIEAAYRAGLRTALLFCCSERTADRCTNQDNADSARSSPTAVIADLSEATRWLRPLPAT